jgi:hypothetical protein
MYTDAAAELYGSTYPQDDAGPTSSRVRPPAIAREKRPQGRKLRLSNERTVAPVRHRAHGTPVPPTGGKFRSLATRSGALDTFDVREEVRAHRRSSLGCRRSDARSESRCIARRAAPSRRKVGRSTHASGVGPPSVAMVERAAAGLIQPREIAKSRSDGTIR